MEGNGRFAILACQGVVPPLPPGCGSRPSPTVYVRRRDVDEGGGTRVRVYTSSSTASPYTRSVVSSFRVSVLHPATLVAGNRFFFPFYS